MSLVETLLFNLPVQKPDGKLRVHKLLNIAPSIDPVTQSDNLAIRARNIARIMDAVRLGYGTRGELSQQTGLAHTTLRRITDQMILDGQAMWADKRRLVLVGDQ